MLRRRTAEGSNEILDEKGPVMKTTKPSNFSKLFFKLLLIVSFILYVVVPVAVYLSPAVRRHAVFLNYVSLSRQKNLSLPTEVGLDCTRNFYIPSGGNIKLGVWHVPPHSRVSKCKNNLLPPIEEFKDNRPVFLYLHGNAGTRGGGHRVELYKVLSEKLDSHVVAFDYRGYGDSTNESPTEAGLVEDTEHVYNWLLQKVPESRIFIWGHSLGTGVGVAFLHKISKAALQPAALILEAPFTRIIDAAKHHPLSIFHRYMPFFEFFIAAPIGDKDTGFDSLSRVSSVMCPLLIIHAEDDGFVPFDHGRKLYETALAARKHLPPYATQFIAFEGKLDLGHKNICKSPDLPKIISQFMKQIKQ
ncbi:lysophosphatidylserine lipase ABHD12-like [Uloborus diversus]|uniref:lysophosphatidylserine lipase ABHD12-like n=1 Tax=Uloborus diversus TaxID=327109 RepID=UPI00240A60F8|nr:lysophosphatidylserine lipase ABHD12-like [Uloborus diversus]